MAIQGVRHTDNFVTDQRPKNWREGVLLLNPNGKAPLTGLTSGLRNQSTDDPEYNWWTKTLQDQRLTVDSDTTSSATSISVSADAQKLVKNHLLYAEETQEIMRVSADPSSGTSITVERGFGGTSAAALNAGSGSGVNPHLLVIGTAFKEGANAPTGLNFDPVKFYNYTQIFRNALEATRTAMKTRLRTGDQVKEAKREALEYHTIEMERAFFWGARNEATQNGKPIRTTGGIRYWVSNNASDNIISRNGSATDLETFEGWMKDMFYWGSQEKMGFCGNEALLTIQQIIRKNASYELVQGQKEFGMNVSRLISPFGTLVLKSHPLFNYSTGGSNNGGDYFGFNSALYVLDMENLRYRYLTDSDTKYLPDRQSNDLDGMKSEYLTECGLELHHPETFFIIEGLTNPAQDS
jgi:hypothetical protein